MASKDFSKPTSTRRSGKLHRQNVTILKGSESFPLLAHQFEKGGSISHRIHRHPETEICYFPSDSGVMLTRNGSHRFGAGDMFLTAGNTYHQPVFDAEENRGMIVLYFLPELLSNIPQEWAHVRTILASPVTGFCYLRKNSDAERLVWQLHHVFHTPDPHREIVCQGILLHLISYFAQATVAYSLPGSKHFPRDEVGKFDSTLEYIQANLHREINAQELYRIAGFSRTRFCTKFKSCFGMTVSAYIQQARLSRAKELLTHTSLSVTEIAYASGFNWPSFFNRTFKRETGMSPSQFRRRED